MSVLASHAPVLHLPTRRSTPRRSERASATRRMASDLLLAGARELVIEHQDSEYHLRLTRNGKLILTK